MHGHAGRLQRYLNSPNIRGAVQMLGPAHEEAINYAKKGSVHANSEGEHGYGERGKARFSFERTDALTEVRGDVGHHEWTRFVFG